MMFTILETLQNAEFNLCQSHTPFTVGIGKEQLTNAVTLLLKGYSTDDDINELMEKYPDLNDAPDVVE